MKQTYEKASFAQPIAVNLRAGASTMHVPKMLVGVLQLYGSLETVRCRHSPLWSGGDFSGCAGSFICRWVRRVDAVA